jgi:hypothetical protein
MSNDITRKAQTGEPTTNGGHFGSVERPEADTELFDESVTVDIGGNFSIDNGGQEPLPPYPTSLPEADVSLNWDDGPETVIYVGDLPLTFWSRGGEPFNNMGYRFDRATYVEAFGSEEAVDEVIEWGEAVHKRVEDNVYSATLAAVSGQVEATILAMAQGKKPVA